MNESAGKFPAIKVFVLIVDADKSKRAVKLLRRMHSHVQHQFYAEGTATSETLDLFGLGGTDKSVTVCVVPGFIADKLLSEVSDELSLHLPGKGIVFTIPVSGVMERVMALINESPLKDIEKLFEGEVSKMSNEIGYHLIIVTIEQGYSEEVVNAAKNAGATGGTVWSARRVGHESAMRLLGITIQGEQEIVAILAPKDKKLGIMKAISAQYGITSEARGLVLSLPVDGIAGLEKGESI